MLRVPVYSGVLKLKNVNKKGLCWQAQIARHRFAHGKALSCCCCIYIYTATTRKGLAMSKPVSSYLSLPAQPFLVDVLQFEHPAIY